MKGGINKQQSNGTPMSKELAQMLLQMKTESREVGSDVVITSQQVVTKDRKIIPKEEIIQSDAREVCNCKKSKCLKLYCQCFSNKIVCDPTCRCVSCANTVDDDNQRSQAIQAILDRNPNAFDSKFQVTEVVDGEVAHKTGCRCRKSMCLKKYCECYQAAIPCSSTCTCLQCMNQSSAAASVNFSTITMSTNTPIPYIPPRPESEDALAKAARDLELLRCLNSASKALFDTDKQVNLKLLELHRPQIEKALSSITTDVSSSGLPPLPPGKSKRNLIENNNSFLESPAMIVQHAFRSASPNSVNVASALSLLGANEQKSTPKASSHTHQYAIQDTTSEEDYDNSSDSSEHRDKCNSSYDKDLNDDDIHVSKKIRTVSDDPVWVTEEA